MSRIHAGQKLWSTGRLHLGGTQRAPWLAATGPHRGLLDVGQSQEDWDRRGKRRESRSPALLRLVYLTDRSACKSCLDLFLYPASVTLSPLDAAWPSQSGHCKSLACLKLRPGQSENNLRTWHERVQVSVWKPWHVPWNSAHCAVGAKPRTTVSGIHSSRGCLFMSVPTALPNGYATS